MTNSSHQKFGFDTVFDNAGGVAYAAPRPKRLFTAEEVEAVRAAAFAEGEQQALGSMAALQAQALSQIAASVGQALPRLAGVAHEHRVGSAELALACARAIADAALAKFPEAPIQAALENLAREIEASPRLIVSCDGSYDPSALRAKTELPNDVWNGYRWYGSAAWGSRPTTNGYSVPAARPLAIISSKVAGVESARAVLRRIAMFSMA